MIAAFRIPPMLLGQRFEPETREDAARERLAYIEGMKLDPFSMSDDDVELVVSVERMWLSGVLSREEALARLSPIQEKISISS